MIGIYTIVWCKSSFLVQTYQRIGKLEKISGNPVNPEGNTNKNPLLGKNTQNISSKPIETGRVTPKRRSVLDNTSNSATLSPELMEKLIGQGQAIPGEISPAMKLHQRLESAGAYERVGQLRDGDRRRRMLQNYLTTPKSAGVIGEEEGIQNRTIAHQLIRSAMDVAFFALPEDQLTEYDNNPEVAWRISAEQKTHTKGERIKETLDERRNPDTGKVEFSETHKQNVAAANQRRGQEIREGTYTGKPVGRPRRTLLPTNTPQEDNFLRWIQELEAQSAAQTEDKPSEQHDPQDDN